MEPQNLEKDKEKGPVTASNPPAQSLDSAARAYDNKTLYIYCPPELALDFIEFSNKEFGGKQYVALKELLRTWREVRHIAYMLADVRDLDEEMLTIKERLTMLENKAWPIEEKKKKTIATMGGGGLEAE